MIPTTREIYNRTSDNWQRKEPILLSDYTARPFLLSWCEPVQDLDILDLGCGEGYFARQLSQRGAGSIRAMDLSEAMIEHAQAQEADEGLGIQFETGHATDLQRYEKDSFDQVVAVFLFNYLTRTETEATMREVRRVLRPGGQFVFAVPHPSLAFQRPEEAPFYFSPGDAGYFSGRDAQFEGEIWRRDGKSVPVRCVHKTLEDYFSALRLAGFQRLPEIKELHVTSEMLAIDPAWFSPLVDQPLHLAFRMENS